MATEISRRAVRKQRHSWIVILSVLLLLTWFGTSIFSRAQQTPAPANFQHVIVIFQENRTPDNLFYGLCSPPYGTADSCSPIPNANQYDIQTNNWLDKASPNGVIQPEPVPLANSYDLSHAHSAFVAQCDLNSSGACRMDGAVGVACSGTCPPTPQFKYVDNSSGILDPYLQLATQYGWANYMFQTNQGPSFPAHQFIFGGTSAPNTVADALGVYASENMSGPNSGVAGCIALATTRVRLIMPDGRESQSIYPCFEHQTMADILPPGVSWRYYAPGAGSIWTAPNAISHICQSTGPGGKCAGTDWTDNVDLTPAHVLTQIGNCQLPSLSWVVPTGANSDHANSNDGGGPSWVASIINAIGTSTCDGSGYWQDTAIVITWDDWGGWYDHEPPTILKAAFGNYQLGFRVPMIFVSAYTPAGYINNVRHDFGSILRFIEHNFGLQLGALNFADSRATTDLTAFYDLSEPPRAFQPINAPKSASFFINDKRPATAPDDDGDDQ